MRDALELAWESARAGSLGVGAVVTDADGNVVARGRNRLAEHDPGDDHLAGSSLAHAEMNALAKLRWGAHNADRLTLWTTLEPCIQCAGAIHIAPIAEVRVLAPDPAFRNIHRMRDLHERIADRRPDYVALPADPHAAFALLLHTHLLVMFGVENPIWTAALPRVTALARELDASGELIALARDHTSLDDALAALWPRLDECVTDIDMLWAQT